MHRIAIGICTLLILGAVPGPIAAEEPMTAQTATQREAARVEEIYDYSVGIDGVCQVYRNAPVAADQIRPAYQVGAGHLDEKRAAEIASTKR